MRKGLLITVVLSVCWLLGAAPLVLFEKPETGGRYLIAESSQLEDTGKDVRYIFKFHPLCRIYDFSEKVLPNGVKGYSSPDFSIKSDGKTPVRKTGFPLEHALAGSICVLLLMLVLYRRICCKANENELLLIPVIVRVLLVLAGREYGVVPIATDEPGYFQTISDMLRGEWRTPWSFTVGTGFLYLPFILFTGAKEFYDIVPCFNYFSAVVFGAGSLAWGFLILRHFSVPAKRACIAMLLWAVFPFISFHFEDWNALKFQQFFHLIPWLFKFHGHFYYGFCINSGFNAMSDMPGLFFVLACLWLSLTTPARLRWIALTGALFGFACLIRINYILLAPVFLFISYSKFKAERLRLGKAFLAGSGAFLAVFAIQLVCNTLQFGSPLTFGYVLHYTQNIPAERPAAGFTWHTFSKLTYLRYLLNVNLPVFALGTAALWVMRDRFKQGVLILMTVPLVVFFCGYSHTFCDARRFVFPAFAGFLMAAASLEFRPELVLREKVKVLIGLSLMLLFCVPFNAAWKGVPFMLGNGLFLRLAGVITPVFLFVVIFGLIRKVRYQAALFVFLAACFYYAPPVVLWGGMFLLLPWMALRIFLPQVEGVFQLAAGGEDLSGKEEGSGDQNSPL